MPRLRSKQILGETPVNPKDIATKEYVDSIAFSGGTGSITILDEGANPFTGTTILNFVGVDVRAQGSGTAHQVNVYIPPPAYASHYNSSDGTTNATVSPTSVTNRYVALPDSEGTPYKIGDWAGGTIHSTIRDSITTLTYISAGLFSIYDLTTTFTVTVYDADGTTPLVSHNTTLTADNTTSANNISIITSGFVADADRYQATVSAVIGIGAILPNGGRFSIKIEHVNSTDGTYTFTQNNVFRDTENLISTISGALTVLPQVPVIKQISGVYFYTLNSEWHVNLPGINNLNSRSYPTTQQISIEDNDLIFSNTLLNANGEGGSYDTFVGGTWTQQHDTTGAEYNKLDWTTNQVNQTNWNHGTGSIDTPFATATEYDWSLVDTENSSTYNYLIDTYQDSSDRNSEMFRSEDLRLESDLSTPWDETLKLPTVDGGTGLQVLGDRLVYPQYDFQPLNPNAGASQPDYTTETGNKTYYRLFETNGANVSNGIIDFTDTNIEESDLISGDVIFEINLNNGLGWHTLNSSYVSGVLQNGDGCRVDPGVYSLDINDSLRFTLGQLQASPPAGTSTYIYFRITFTNSAIDKFIDGIDLIGGNWI